MVLVLRKMAVIFLELLVCIYGQHKVGLVILLLVVPFPLALLSKEGRFHGATLSFVIALVLSFQSEGG